MTQFARHRNAQEIIDLCKKTGKSYSSDAYESGSDHLIIHLPGPIGEPVRVFYNTINGRFFHTPTKPNETPFSSDDNLDNQPWFADMLNFFYVPHAQQPAQLAS